MSGGGGEGTPCDPQGEKSQGQNSGGKRGFERIPLVLCARPSKQPLMVRTFLKEYMELGSYFLFLQEQVKDIIICFFSASLSWSWRSLRRWCISPNDSASAPSPSSSSSSATVAVPCAGSRPRQYPPPPVGGAGHKTPELQPTQRHFFPQSTPTQDMLPPQTARGTSINHRQPESVSAAPRLPVAPIFL
jgi:hypothetical protein